MNHPTITIKIEDRIYHLDISDGPGLRDIPGQDKQELLLLLKGIEKQEMLTKGGPAADQPIKVEPEQNKPAGAGLLRSSSVVVTPLAEKGSQEAIGTPISQEKPISRDADQLMARLIADEKKHQKSFSKRQFYVIFSVVSLLILLLMLLFV